MTDNMEDVPDRIYEVFRDRTVFITGGTGFVGKVLIERLLRVMDVKKVFILIRNKKSKTPQQRLQVILDNPLFDKAKSLKGDSIVKKCHPIFGDVTLPSLNLSPEDRLLLQKEVEFVYHSAATVRFDEPLKRAITVNTGGTYAMIQLAKQMENLKLFVHVSTAYCHPEQKVVLEKLYPTGHDAVRVTEVMEYLDNSAVEAIAPDFLKGVPNTYTISKALAEDLVGQAFDELPIIVARPSIVVPIWKKPIPGWVDNLNGPIGLLTAAGKGVCRTMYGKRDAVADFVSVDVIADSLCCITAYSVMNNIPKRIFNLCVAGEVSVSWGEVIDLGRNIAEKEIPFDMILWRPGGNLRSNWYYNQIMVVLTHLIPAVVVDILLKCFGYKPFLLKVQERIQAGVQVLAYYTRNEWTFNNNNGVSVRNWMTEKEQELYTVDARDLDIRNYFVNCMLSARRYLLNEPDENLPKARRTMKIMIGVDFILNILIKIILVYVFYKYIFLPVFG